MISGSRRQFLRGSAACIALPLLPSLMKAAPGKVDSKIKKACFINMANGLMAKNFFPEKEGKNYKPSLYLSKFGKLNEQMVIFKGLSHEKLSNHFMEHCFLTGVYSGNKKDKRSAVSVDTVFAENIGQGTRFPLLSAWPFPGSHYKTPSITYNRSGTPVQPTKTPIELYNKLFVKGDAGKTEKAAVQQNILQDKSILDEITQERRDLQRRVNIADKQVLEEYYASIRDLEKSMSKGMVGDSNKKLMANLKTKPEVFKNAVTLEQLELVQSQVFDLLYLALMTDTTNVVSMHYASDDQPFDMIFPDGTRSKKNPHHVFAHHGNDPKRIAGLEKIEWTSINALAKFYNKLNSKNQYGQRLLDSTMVFCGSNLGNSNNHDGKDMPIMALGAGFEKDQGHYYNISKDKKQIPLCNLFQSMLHKIGDQNEKFNIGTGHLDILKS